MSSDKIIHRLLLRHWYFDLALAIFIIHIFHINIHIQILGLVFLACCIIYCIGISWKVYNVCKGTYVEEEPVFLKYKWSAHKQNKQLNKQTKTKKERKKKVLPKHCRTSPRNKLSCEFPCFFPIEWQSSLLVLLHSMYSRHCSMSWTSSRSHATFYWFKIGKLVKQYATTKSACAHVQGSKLSSRQFHFFGSLHKVAFSWIGHHLLRQTKSYFLW